MAFLDNSGDIILDAVLTDTGRQRLARGDGSFRIAKFALADDEVDYAKYDKLAATGRKDLEILQTPVLEAFTNNKHRNQNPISDKSRQLDKFHSRPQYRQYNFFLRLVKRYKSSNKIFLALGCLSKRMHS